MISADCDSIRDDLDAFADGELRGAELRHVANHLEACRSCAGEVAARQNLGGLIREAVAGGYQDSIPAGLAAGVVTRARTESYFSWRAVFSRAVEDPHWAIVGCGAVMATCISTLLFGALLLSSTAKPDAESLSALGTSLQSSPGALFAEVSRQGGDKSVMLVQVDTGDGMTMTLPDVLRREDEEWRLIDALGEALARQARYVDISRMPAAERKYTQWLLDSIARLRGESTHVGPLGALTVHRLHLVTNTDVTAKGLD